MREKFYFFWTFWETAQAIEDKDQRLEYLEAVIRHWIGDEEKKLSPLVNALMVQTRFTLDRSQEIATERSEEWIQQQDRCQRQFASAFGIHTRQSWIWEWQ